MAAGTNLAINSGRHENLHDRRRCLGRESRATGFSQQVRQC